MTTEGVPGARSPRPIPLPTREAQAMPTTDDLDLIRSLLTEPGPAADVIERGRSRLAELTAAELTATELTTPELTALGRPDRAAGQVTARRRALVRWPAATGTGLVAAG